MSFEHDESLLKKTILEDFEIKGGWVADINDLNNVKKFKYGTLKYSPTNIQMELFQGFPSKNEKSLYVDDDPQRYPTIYGQIANNNAWYVKAVNNSELSLPMMRGLSLVCTQKLNVSYFTVFNFAPSENVKMNRLILTSNFFNDWFKPRQEFIEFKQDSGYKIEVHNNGEEHLGSFENRGTNFDIYLEGNVNRKCNSQARKIDLINDSYIKIRSDDSIEAKIAIELSEEFSDLLSTIAATQINFSLISLNGKGNRKKNIFVPPLIYPITKEKNSYIFKSENFDFEKLIYNWFNKSPELKLMIDDYLLTVRYNETIEDKLINLTEGIESFCRNERDDRGRKLSLLDAMKNVVHALPSFIIEKMNSKVGNIDEWMEKLKDSRVFLAHGTDRDNRSDNINELIIQVRAFQFLIQCFIMKELGYDLDKSQRNILYEINKIYAISFL